MIQIIPLKGEHLEDAALLVASRYKTLYQQQTVLPNRFLEAHNVLPLLQNSMRAACPGVAAIHDGQLVGFLTAWLMPNFRGKRSVYSPEWANAAKAENCRFIYEEMVREIAGKWVAHKYIAHYISIFANDRETIRTFHWLGFGMLGIDAVRGLQPVKQTNAHLHIHRAGLEDIEAVMALHKDLVQYAKSAPNFFIAQEHSQAYFEGWLDDQDKVIWLASIDDEPVAFFRMGPANEDVCALIDDPKTTSIYEAFTQETMRGKKIGTSLLAKAIAAAQSAGDERCAVDFETTNLSGTRFWLGQGFKPVCYSLLRYIDERVV